MKIQICSDLHLEFSKNREWLKHNPLVPKSETLIIAGDTYYLERDYSKLDFINKISKDFKHVYLIPGNHEYYGGYNAATALLSSQIEIKKNVHMLNNTSVQIGDTNFIFSTLWSKIEKHINEIKMGMNDFRLIKFEEKRLTINDYNMIHNKAFDFISNEIKKEGKKVVITHHLPSEHCNADEFKGSDLNEAFCVEKTEFILNSNVDYWVYGHSHRNIDGFKIGNTNMITNQFGYAEWDEHKAFDYEKVIEV
ncbi:metallophosphoesterase [Algibacter sp. 2305UL17-15]|uniref:metallophosphoesterase n=1 Tax=Algibacter sp. 2305UL17-15 TaxID=3231268 RepID=UPI0034578333